MSSATIKLFLSHGDPHRLRTAEISNWSGKSVAAPRTDLDDLFARTELTQAGVYLLLGADPETGRGAVYVGEAEVLADRLRQHRDKDFWNQVIVFLSKDDNLTRAHIKFLEGRLIDQARATGRLVVLNDRPSGAKLPESDRADMEIFFAKIAQLLPVLGTDLLVPRDGGGRSGADEGVLTCEIRGLVARGKRTAEGFVVFKDSQASLDERPSAAERHAWILSLRERLIAEKRLVKGRGALVFSEDVPFASPSAAAGVVQGGGANGLISWRDAKGRTLREIEGGS